MTRRLLGALGGRPASRGVWLIDLLVAAVLLAFELAVTAVVVGPGSQDLAFDPGAISPDVVALTVLAYLPLLWRQRFPVPVLAAVLLVDVVGSLAFGIRPGAVAILPALYAVGAWSGWRLGAAALAAVSLAALLQRDILSQDLLLVPLILGSPLAMGWGSQRRRRQRRERELQAERARRERAWRIVVDERARMARRERERSLRTVVGERERVARELHDLLAHSIGVMVEEAVAGRRILRAAPDRAAEALSRIETTGRGSMSEVRRLLALLRGELTAPEMAPQPGLADLRDLVGQVREAGLPVTVMTEVCGARWIPASIWPPTGSWRRP